MKKKIFALSMAALLLALVAVGGTLAYFTADDSAVNTMTLGSVAIEQLEYERIVEEGAWVSSSTEDAYGYYPDLLQPFTQNKPLYPAVFADGVLKYDDRESGHQQSWGEVDAPGRLQLFDDSVKGAVDKMVFVKNTGKSECYVRTLIAIECGSTDGSFVAINADISHWGFTPSEYITAEINGNNYIVIEAIYVGSESNPNCVLAPGAVSYPSLAQLYMLPEATGDDVAAIDGNGNSLLDVLVLSQACQVAGFEGVSAKKALDTAFGDVTAANAKTWFEAILAQA